MESCTGRVIVVARRLDGRLLLAALGRRERLLEAADRRAESASCLWQSLGAEHHQRDGDNQEQMCGAEDVLDHLWSLWFGRVGPLYMRRGPARAGRAINRYGRCELTLLGGGNNEGPASAAPRRALISRPTNAARRTTPHSRRASLTLSGVRSLSERRDAGEELWRLPVEQSHCGQGLRGAHGSALRLAGPDDGADGELPVEEFRRLGHDQVGPVQLTARVQVGERQP